MQKDFLARDGLDEEVPYPGLHNLLVFALLDGVTGHHHHIGFREDPFEYPDCLQRGGIVNPIFRDQGGNF